jgi:hypothetical protein
MKNKTGGPGCAFALMRVAAWVAVLFMVFTRGLAHSAEAVNGGKQELFFFFSPTCHECQKIKSEFLPRLMAANEGKVNVVYCDISREENFKRLFDLGQRVLGKARREIKVPAVYYAGRLLIGGEEIRQSLEGLIAGGNPVAGSAQITGGSYNPIAYFESFTPLAVTAAGLVDGINPCAFTVIVFFVSFLALQGFGKRRLTIIGLVFIAGVFITYLLIGLGLFGFFYTLNAFWWVRTAANWGIGILSIGFGIAAVIDAASYKKNGKTDGMILSLPPAVKNKIHAVIGMQYRSSSQEGQRATMPRLIIATFVIGVLVSLLEAVCTGQMYLPTIIFVLKSTPVKVAAFAYLVLYNLMFILPLVGVLALAVFGVSSGQFSRFMAKNLLSVKVLMAIMFFTLGVFLLWRG